MSFGFKFKFISSNYKKKITNMEFTYKNDALLTVKTEKPSFLTDNIKGEIFHKSFLNYLSYAYANHYGIVIKPDYIWFTILNEMSRIVNSNPQQYREIFTSSDKVIEISVPTNDSVIMPIDLLLKQLFLNIPSDLKESNIILEFSTLTESSKLAFSSAFLEAASPFYSYGMFMCGFNKIKRLGTTLDYKIMKQAVLALSLIFEDKPIESYFKKIIPQIEKIISNFENQDFWKDIFYVERCGSGHQKEVMGWFGEFFDTSNCLKVVDAYPTHKSVITYKNLSTNEKFKMEVGLFASVVNDGYMVTDFEYGVNRID